MRKRNFKWTSVLLTAAMVFSTISTTVFAADFGKLKAVGDCVELDGDNPGSATVSITGTTEQKVYNIEGSWDTEEQEGTGYFELSDIGSDVLIFDLDEGTYADAESGEVLWDDTEYASLTNGVDLLTATYKVAADTPAGTYTVSFTSEVFTDDDKVSDETETVFTATITVTRPHVHTPSPAATCTDPQICTDPECGVELAPAKGHTPSAEAICTAQNCTVCGEVVTPKKDHTPGAAATCTAAQTCTECGEELAPAKGHTPGAAATCTDPQTCTVCGAELASAKGHTPGPEATEEAPQKCTVCGTILKPALPHTHVTKDVPAVPADCENDGNIAHYICTKCEELFKDAEATQPTDAEGVKITAKGHKFTDKIADAAHKVPGTGTNCQSPVKYYYDCAACDKIGTDSWTSETYGDHQQSTVVYPNGDGTHSYKCTVEGCGIALGDKVTCSGGTATCKDKAVCSECGGKYGELGAHEYDTTQWGYRKADGHAHICKVCGGNDGVVAHTAGPAATETEDQICTVCNFVITPSLGHLHHLHLTKVEGSPATCTVDGVKAHYVCDCGEKFEDAGATKPLATAVIKAPGHTGGTATCIEKKTCSVCGEKYGEFSKTNHVGETEIRDAKEMTETENGYTGDVWCLSCNTRIKKGSVIYAPSDDEEEVEEHRVSIKKDNGGNVLSDSDYAEEGELVRLIVEPKNGYALRKVVVTDANGKEIKLTSKGNGVYTFRMPDSKVSVKTTWIALEENESNPNTGVC